MVAQKLNIKLNLIILENESTALDIRITANVASTSAVKMYYRLSNADDARNMGDLAWRPFNDDGTPDTAVAPSENRYQFKEHKFSASRFNYIYSISIKNYNDWNKFLLSTNSKRFKRNCSGSLII